MAIADMVASSPNSDDNHQSLARKRRIQLRAMQRDGNTQDAAACPQQQQQQPRKKLRRDSEEHHHSSCTDSDSDSGEGSSATITIKTSTTTLGSSKPSIRGIKKQARYEPGVPMTKEELAAWRKEARRVRNRESAAASRSKTRARIQELEEQVDNIQSKYGAALRYILRLEEQRRSHSLHHQHRSCVAPDGIHDDLAKTAQQNRDDEHDDDNDQQRNGGFDTTTTPQQYQPGAAPISPPLSPERTSFATDLDDDVVVLPMSHHHQHQHLHQHCMNGLPTTSLHDHQRQQQQPCTDMFSRPTAAKSFCASSVAADPGDNDETDGRSSAPHHHYENRDDEGPLDSDFSNLFASTSSVAAFYPTTSPTASSMTATAVFGGYQLYPPPPPQPQQRRPSDSDATGTSGYYEGGSSSSATEGSETDEPMDEEDTELGEFLWDALSGFDPSTAEDLTKLCL